ncbi:DUF317 domain-containing protein [Kitasatospora hibisci]|uniref:DUF317 domain-containing protein n=1 Tax=Kitasatospora hibisci TaxID=3369522 RepID=UPI0037543415
MEVYPGYLAGPGGAAQCLSDFLTGRNDWNIHHSTGSTAVIHEKATTLLELDHSSSAGPGWTLAGYRTPNGRLDWTATFCPRTPAEVPTAVLRRLAYALSQPTDAERDRQLWGSTNTGPENAIEHEVDFTGDQWCRGGDLTGLLTYTSPHATAGIDIDGLHANRPLDLDPVFTVWGGIPGREDERWRARFTRWTPTVLITEAVRTVTRPAAYRRLSSQIPMAHRARLFTSPLHRPHPETTRAR